MTATVSASTTEPPADTTATGPDRRARMASTWPALYGGALGAVLFWVSHNALADDSYITASYARNLAFRGEWGLVPGIPANSATSPLNVALLAAVTEVTRNPIAAIAVLLVAALAVTAWWLREVTGSAVTAALGVTVLACSPLLNSTIGLETYLSLALLVGSVRYALAGRWIAAGVTTGLMVLARPDLAVAAVAVAVAAAVLFRRAKGPLVVLGLGAVIGASWPAFSMGHFGTLVSDTLPAKSVAGGWGDWTMADGLGHYLGRWWISAVLVLVLLAVGGLAVLVLAWRAARGRADRGDVAGLTLAIAGLADYAALSALRVAPFFWYYAPLVAGLALAAVIAARPRPRTGRVGRTVGWAGLAVVVAVAVVAPGGYAVARGVPWNGTAPIRINWATPGEYRAIAEGLPTGAVVESPGEVGVLAYYCNTRCTVVDYLADRGRMAPYIDEYRRQHPGRATRILFARWQPPAPVPVTGKITFGAEPPAGAPQWPTTFPGAPTRPMWLEPR